LRDYRSRTTILASLSAEFDCGSELKLPAEVHCCDAVLHRSVRRRLLMVSHHYTAEFRSSDI